MSSQSTVLINRQFRLVISNRLNLVFLIVLPILVGILLHVIPGSNGFLKSDSDSPTEAVRLLAFVMLGCCLMGLTLSMRDIVSNREVIAHEIFSGLKAHSFVISKVCVLAVMTFIQSFLLILIVVLTYQMPENGIFTDVRLELLFAAWVTTFSNAILALFISGLLTNNSQTMPALAIIVLSSIIMCGALVPVNRTYINEFSLLFPTRWGFAISASSMDSNNSFYVPDSFTDKDLNDFRAQARMDQEAYELALNNGSESAVELHRKAVHSADIAQKIDDATKVTIASETDDMWNATLDNWLNNLVDIIILSSGYAIGCYLTVLIGFRHNRRRMRVK